MLFISPEVEGLENWCFEWMEDGGCMMYDV